jgi:hypothetical protein
MTYWATLWYASSVVLSIGYEGQTLEQCQDLSKLMLSDFKIAYVEKKTELDKSMFPDNKFKVTCETEMLPIDEKYAE